MKFDDFLFKNLGEIGKFQAIQLVLVCIPMFFVSSEGLSWTFASVDMPFRCKLPGETTPVKYQTDSLVFSKCEDEEKNMRNISDWGKEGIQCEYNEKCSANGQKCSEHVFYHPSEFTYMATERWDLVCDHAWIKALVQAFYYIGQLFGSYSFGVLGDKLGRKMALYISLILQIPFCLLVILAPWWWLYTISRFLIGFAHAGTYLLANVAGMETVGPKYRKLAGVGIGYFSAFGQIGLGVVAYFVRDYVYLHTIFAVPTLVYVLYWWLVPESLRWLVSKQRYQDADVVLRKAAKMNKKEIPDEWWEDLDKSNSGEDVEHLTTFDLFKTTKLRRRTLIMFFVWPVITMVYYGISMKSNILGGDIYTNFILCSAIELPAITLVALLNDRLGRRTIVSAALFISGISLILNLVVDESVGFIMAVLQMTIAKGAITLAFATSLIYSPELYPTTVRNTATGLLATIARIGAIFASFIAMWIADYGKVYMIVPFGIGAIIASALTIIFLPETMGKPLPDTLEDVEGDENNYKTLKDAETASEEESDTDETK